MRHVPLCLAPVALALSLLSAGCDPPQQGGLPTVASVDVVRPVVEIDGPTGKHAVGLRERLPVGATITVTDRAQAVVRHDAGARLLVDGGAALQLTERGARMTAGRLWATAGAGAPLEMQLGGLTLLGAGAGFEISATPPAITVIRGEVSWRGEAGRGVIRAGERGEPGGPGVQVKPVVLWEDWTGGLGWPDPRRGQGPTGLAEVGARRPGDLGEARFPLTVQRVQVRARISDDLAITTVEQTFFNPADATLEGIYRVRIPEGALLTRFAIDRHGRLVDGYVKERETARQQYQRQVYAGSTHDPALLEWESPGSYRARLYPLPPGAKRRVLFTYSEWLTPHGKDGALRTYRYPMAAAAQGGAPLLQELDIEVDARDAGADTLRAGLGAILPKGERRVVLQRTDYQPSADLVVELVGPARPADEARAYRVPHVLSARASSGTPRREDDYVLIRALPLPARPAEARAPLDVVLLVDLSAATDDTHLTMARTLTEAVLRHLGAEDRVAVLGADLDLHQLGADKGASALQAVTPELRERLLSALGSARQGGATDLGATLSAAAALLSPERLGAVLYIGDAQPTVGELDLGALRERLQRLPAPLRLYGVGIGAEADLGLLSGLSGSAAGQAYRVSDRAAAAEAALGIITHLSRPAATGLSVQAGTDVDRGYPRAQQPVASLAGEPLVYVARARGGLPREVTVDGMAEGKPLHRTFRVSVREIKDTADVRLRWAEARLQELLQSGVGIEAVAELGVRQNLITPYTSYYVPSEDEIGQLEAALPRVRAAGCARSAPESEAPASAVASAPAPAKPSPRQMAASEGKMGKKEASRFRDANNRAEEESDKRELAKTNKMMSKDADDESGAPTDRAPSPEAVLAAPAAAAAPIQMEKNVMDALKGGDIGGLGLRGTGEGGGGTGHGTIGLDGYGSLGQGISDAKLRRAAPRPTSRSAPAEVATKAPEVSGSLDKDIIRRVFLRHMNEIRFCYERALAKNPGAQGTLTVHVRIGARGQVESAEVQGSTLGNAEVESCIASAARRWSFPAPPGGGSVEISYPLVLRPGRIGQAPTLRTPSLVHGRRPSLVHGRRPSLVHGRRPPRATGVLITQPTDGAETVSVIVAVVPHRPRGCSAASSQSAEERAELWRERLDRSPSVHRAQEVWQDALQGCELPRWTDRRSLLRLMLRACQRGGGPQAMVQLYQFFGDAPEEQEFLRKAILGEVKTPRDLRVIFDGMGLGAEERETLTQEVISSAKTLPERLRRVRELLLRFPQDLRMKLVRMETEEALGQRDAARRTAEEIGRDPFADAQARTAVGELLLRQKDVPAARRMFSEIVEFAPRDALARRRLGDLYRAHGWFDEASRQYATLATLAPGDATVLVLQGLAAAGAGHVEQGLGLLERVTGTAEPGGAAAGLPRAALLLSGLRLAQLREEARTASQAEQAARLLLRARRNGALGLARPVRVFLSWAHPEADLEIEVTPAGQTASPADELWPQLGLLGWRSDKDAAPTGDLQILVRRGDQRPLRYDAELTVVRDEGQKGERVSRLPISLAPDQSTVRISAGNGTMTVVK